MDACNTLGIFTLWIHVLLIIYTGTVQGAMQDIAAGQPVTMEAAKSAPELAVDSDASTCTYTATNMSDTRLTIDLGVRRTITSVDIDAGNQTIPYLEIYVADDPGGTDICHLYSGTNTNTRIFCYSPNQGRYVTIANTKRGGLHICDVKINECDNMTFGKMCTDECHCRDGLPCNKASGRCDLGCDRGWGGSTCQDECMDGMFGHNCELKCHCEATEGNRTCDKYTGTCAKCIDNFFGPSCQTELPALLTQPTAVESLSDSIILQWMSWQGVVEEGYKVTYRIEYMMRSFESIGSNEWQRGPVMVPTDSIYQRTPVTNLQVNKYYYFRVVPRLEEPSGTVHTGARSPRGGPIRTKCLPPEAPVIGNVTSFADLNRNPPTVMLTVTWQGPSQDKVNCDNIKVYKIYYTKVDKDSWQIAMAGKNMVARNISGLEFESTYKVMVTAVNNMDLSSNSVTSMVTTVEDEKAAPPPPSTDLETGLIAGVVIGVVVMLAVAVVIVLVRKSKSRYMPVPPKDPEDNGIASNGIKLNNVCRMAPQARKQDKSPTGDSGVGIDSPPPDHTPSSSSSGGSGDMAALVDKQQQAYLANEQRKKEFFESEIVGHPISVDDLEAYVMERRDNEAEDLRSEYKSMPEGFVTNCDHGKSEGNKHKNRFINIIAYNHSRVILEPVEGDPESDYVNANYIDGYQKPRHYIAAQGCNKWTIQDMWRMMWQENSRRIVMVTNLNENGKRKCEQYWPSSMNETKSYGGIGVRWVDTEHTSDFVIRTFDLTKDGETRNIKQLHFTAWPDHGVPNRASPIIHFRRKVRSYDESHPGLILVHCSAGVGRTGTFIALDYSLDKAKEENEVDVYALTQSMRKQRVNMIQTEEQYLFVYDALLEALKSGNTAIPCSDFRGEYALMCRVDPTTEKSALQTQFETLQTMSPKVRPEDCSSGAMEENLSKNRVPSILPADRHRPYLMTRVPGTNDYINAVFLDGYKSKNAYIVSQMPLPHTVIDFWRMVYEHNCGAIVMLNQAEGSGEDDYGQYWPDDEACECGPFVIEPIDTNTNHNDISIRELRLIYDPEWRTKMQRKTESSPVLGNGRKSAGLSKVRTVYQFMYTAWPKDAHVPRDKRTLINLIELVDRSQLKTGNGPVLIHCHDGVRHSGLYASVSCIWEKMKTEQEVDIFHTIKQMRYHRPQLIHHFDQYKFCFDMVLAYLAEFALYANFEKLGPKVQPVYENAEEIKKHNAEKQQQPAPPSMVKSSSKAAAEKPTEKPEETEKIEEDEKEEEDKKEEEEEEEEEEEGKDASAVTVSSSSSSLEIPVQSVDT